MSADCGANPALRNASLVAPNHCDGNSFASDRAAPVAIDPSSGRELVGAMPAPPAFAGWASAAAAVAGRSCMEGALAAGGDVGVASASTLAEAEAHCARLANCSAFTYQLPAAGSASRMLEVY